MNEIYQDDRIALFELGFPFQVKRLRPGVYELNVAKRGGSVSVTVTTPAEIAAPEVALSINPNVLLLNRINAALRGRIMGAASAPQQECQLRGERCDGVDWLLVTTADDAGFSFEYAATADDYWLDVRGAIQTRSGISEEEVASWLRSGVVVR